MTKTKNGIGSGIAASHEGCSHGGCTDKPQVAEGVRLRTGGLESSHSGCSHGGCTDKPYTDRLEGPTSDVSSGIRSADATTSTERDSFGRPRVAARA
jgi:hypothetical protein